MMPFSSLPFGGVSFPATSSYPLGVAHQHLTLPAAGGGAPPFGGGGGGGGGGASAAGPGLGAMQYNFAGRPTMPPPLAVKATRPPTDGKWSATEVRRVPA